MALRTRPKMKLNLDQSLPNEECPGKPGSGGGNGGASAKGFSKPALETTSPFATFSKVVDPSGKLNFSGKAVLSQSGVEFSSGLVYKIKMSDLILGPDLGQGHYGTVKKVIHSPTSTRMAMKEIRLELDEKRLSQILMELDVLHRAKSPEIVEFYGAFFIESCVYYCMEFMDVGSLDKLYYKSLKGFPEHVLCKVALSMVKGLKFLKDSLSVMHRDVKPTNVLINTKGEIKLCDFGVSGQLIQSMANTHIGCQSYMPPERIMSSNSGAYTTASDVWSLGMSLLECALGRYPYSNADTVFAQLTQIIQGIAPALPEGYSLESQRFINLCLNRDPKKRPDFGGLLQHPWLANACIDDQAFKTWLYQAMIENHLEQTPALQQPQ